MTPTIYVYSNKALRNRGGFLAATKSSISVDRVFLVVPNEVLGETARGRHWFQEFLGQTKRLLAWKCELTQRGLRHPAFSRLLKYTEDDLKLGIIAFGKRGQDPSFDFTPDSFYQRITVEGLIERSKKKEVTDVHL